MRFRLFVFVSVLAAVLFVAGCGQQTSPAAKVTSFTSSSEALPASGGSTVLSWNGIGVTDYSLAVSPSAGVMVNGAPYSTSVDMRTGTSAGATLPSNLDSISVVYTFTLTATGSKGTTAVTKTVKVTVLGAAGFTLALAPESLSAGLADLATTTLLLTSMNGFSGTLQLSLLDGSGNPAFGVSVSPANVTLTAGQSASVPLKVSPAAALPAGTFSFTLSATGGGVTHTSPLTLVLSSSATGGFAAASGNPFTVGSSPATVAVGDFDGDGNPDLAVANNGDGTVSVLLGDGTGGFASASGNPFTVGTGPVSAAVADINDDGNPDLAVANFNGGTVSVLLGDGAGGFAPASGNPVTVGGYPISVAIGDFDGDRNPDLAVADITVGTVSVLAGDGTGAFAPTGSSPFAVGTSPVSVAVGDFDGDGNPDLAVANDGDGTLSVLLGDGTGGLAPASGSPFTVGRSPNSVAVADFNDDGNPDLAVANYRDGTVSVLLGDGTGGFAPASGNPVTVGRYPTSVAIGDFDGDGNPDLAVANKNDSSVSVVLGDGTGGFAPASGSPFTVGTGPYSVAVGDYNGDGKLDLATANGDDGTVSVLLGQ